MSKDLVRSTLRFGLGRFNTSAEVAAAVEIAADRPLAFHADGEVFTGSTRLRIGVRHRALRVRVPPRP